VGFTWGGSNREGTTKKRKLDSWNNMQKDKTFSRIQSCNKREGERYQKTGQN